MVEVIKNVLLAFVVIHAVESFLRDTHYNRPRTARTKVWFIIILTAWIMIRAAPGFYYGTELFERVVVMTST